MTSTKDGHGARGLEEASEQALRGAHIIQRLRDLVTRGETEKQIETLPALIEEASALALAGSGCPASKSRSGSIRRLLRSSRTAFEIQQVLINLIRNAAEAMAETKRRELEVTTTLIDDETVQVAVADRGPGLPKEMAGELFRPFVSSKRDGMGLGLVICRSIVEAHGGRLWSEPNPGGGTIFLFSLGSGLMAESECRLIGRSMSSMTTPPCADRSSGCWTQPAFALSHTSSSSAFLEAARAYRPAACCWTFTCRAWTDSKSRRGSIVWVSLAGHRHDRRMGTWRERCRR